jgi:hypothetical protein
MVVSYDFIIPAFGRHVTEYEQFKTLHNEKRGLSLG